MPLRCGFSGAKRAAASARRRELAFSCRAVVFAAGVPLASSTPDCRCLTGNASSRLCPASWFLHKLAPIWEESMTHARVLRTNRHFREESITRAYWSGNSTTSLPLTFAVACHRPAILAMLGTAEATAVHRYMRDLRARATHLAWGGYVFRVRKHSREPQATGVLAFIAAFLALGKPVKRRRSPFAPIHPYAPCGRGSPERSQTSTASAESDSGQSCVGGTSSSYIPFQVCAGSSNHAISPVCYSMKLKGMWRASLTCRSTRAAPVSCRNQAVP